MGFQIALLGVYCLQLFVESDQLIDLQTLSLPMEVDQAIESETRLIKLFCFLLLNFTNFISLGHIAGECNFLAFSKRSFVRDGEIFAFVPLETADVGIFLDICLLRFLFAIWLWYNYG